MNTLTFTAAMTLNNLIPEALAEPIKLWDNFFFKEFESFSNEDDFWSYVRNSYTVSPNIINLNNGGVSPQPKIVQDAHQRYMQLSNEAPSYYMWRILDMGREPLREKLAKLADCNTDEIAIDRNSTEALNTVIFGLNLKAGDEVILSKQDYPNMINAWKQRELRDGIKLVWVNHELPSENKAEMIKTYTNAFTQKTKMVHLTHIINWTGQILPAEEIIEAAHAAGAEVLLDAAHSFAHFDFSFSKIGADYIGTSLHKWLCAPFGTGMLYIKKEKIKDIWPLFCSDHPRGDDIRKFENIGTRSIPAEMSIGTAADFHDAIGIKRKEARLRFLKDYWTKQATQIPNVKFNTSLKPEFSCAIANFSIEGMTPNEVDSQLFQNYKIHTVAINWENIHGVRVTPHVYTSTKDLDKLVDAINDIAKKKKG